MCLYSNLFCISSVVVIVWQYRDVCILTCFVFLVSWLLFGSTKMCLYSHLFYISSVVVIVWQYRDVSVFSSVLYF